MSDAIVPRSTPLPAGLAEPSFDPNAMRVLSERYLAKKANGEIESAKELLWRVASAIAEPERPYAQRMGREGGAVVDGVAHAFYDMMVQRDFLPNTPCLVNAGRPLSMLSACFVLPVPDSIEGIFYNLKAMALIQKSGGGCVSADSRVWTTFCGLEPIEVLFNRATVDGRPGVAHGSGIAYDVADLGIRTISMDGATGKTALKPVSHVWKFDVPSEAQVEVRTREGVEVQTSAWHPFMVLRERAFVEVRADELQPGDVILGPDRPDALWPWNEYRHVAGLRIDEEIGWLIGFTLGDGSFSYVPALRQERLRWFAGTADVLERVREIMGAHGIDAAMSDSPHGATRCITTVDESFVAAMLAACGFAKRSSKDEHIRIPEHVAKSPLSVVRAFVAGLLDSDGTVDRDGSPSYTTASSEMAHDLAALMSLLGFQPTLKRKESRGRGGATYAVLLSRLPHVNELAGDIAEFMASTGRRSRLHSDSRVQTALALPFAYWRDALRSLGLAQMRGGAGAGPLAAELDRWSCNPNRRVRRDDLARIGAAIAPHDAPAGELLTTLARRGQEIESVTRAARAMAYYDLTVGEWNTYASGRTGLALIHNTGFAFSELRHQGAEVHSTGKDASGPVSFMKVFNAATDSIKQGGVRRGANMGVLAVDHPDIFPFMQCKKELDAENRALWNRFSDTGRYTDAQLAHLRQELLQTQINNFNISVGVTDAFMTAVKDDTDFELRDPRTKAVVRTVRAREIWDAIVEGAWQNGEPGVLFLDHPDVNPLPGLGPIAATNPCITGDTLVAVADGRGHVRIDELAREGKDVPVFCLDDRGKIAVRTMRHPRKTAERALVNRIILDDGSVLRATLNHKFMLRDGTYREVRQLQHGDSLRLVTKFEAPVDDVIKSARTASKQNYWWLSAGGANVRAEHRLIAEHFSGKAIPRGSVVHHKDRNAQNNAPTNLQVMTKVDHDRHHAEEMLGDRNPMRRALRSWNSERWSEYKAKHSLNNSGVKNKRFSGVQNETKSFAKERSLPEQFSSWRQEHLSGGVRGLSIWAVQSLGGLLTNVDPRVLRHFDEALEAGYEPEIVGGVLFVVKDCEVCREEFRTPYVYREIANCSRACNLSRLNSDAEIEQRLKLRERQLEVYVDLKGLGDTVSKRDWVAACKERGVSAEISRRSSPYRSYAALQEAATMFNHRVVSVEFDCEQDVYNGTVDEFHNFCVGGFETTTGQGRRRSHYLVSMNCGEQFLHGYDSCNLGSLNVGHFYDERSKNVDWERLAQSTALALRFLDNVIDANIYPIDEIRDMVTSNRRVGLGIMGFAELLIRLHIAYGSPEAIAFAGKLMAFIQQRAEETSELLARERGDFPNKHLSIWANDPRPRRNAALLSIAPTGTISMIAGCAFGCEPYFGMSYTKHVMKDAEGRPQHLYYVVPLFEEVARAEGFFSDELLGKIEENRGSLKGLAEVPQHWQHVFTTSADVSVDQHIDMLAAFQKNTCNAVSKTINAPNDDTPQNVSRAIFRAYEAGCKGFTYYRDGSRTEQVVTFSKDNDLAGGNRDVARVAALPASAATAPQAGTDELDIDALLAKANALLEVR